MRLAILGLISIWMSLTALSGPAPAGTPAETPTDTGDSGWDTGDDGGSGDSADTDAEDTDTADSGDTGDTGWDTGEKITDTGDTGDASYTDGTPASELAGEEGGFGCATAPSRGGLSLLGLGVLLVGLRRRS